MKYYIDNKAKKIYGNNIETDKHEIVLYITAVDGNQETTLGRGETCVVSTGFHLVADGMTPIFTHSSHVALHLDRYWYTAKDSELMLQVANPSTQKLTLTAGDEIASFVLVENKVPFLHRVNTVKDLLE